MTWRDPTDEEMARLRAAVARGSRKNGDRPTPLVERARVQVKDDYTDDTPGYAGRLAVVVWGTGAADTFRLDGSDIPERVDP